MENEKAYDTSTKLIKKKRLMMRKLIVLSALSFIVSLTLTVSVMAYTLYPFGGSYSSPPLNKYYWNGVGTISGINTSQAVTDAISRWNNRWSNIHVCLVYKDLPHSKSR